LGGSRGNHGSFHIESSLISVKAYKDKNYTIKVSSGNGVIVFFRQKRSFYLHTPAFGFSGKENTL